MSVVSRLSRLNSRLYQQCFLHEPSKKQFIQLKAVRHFRRVKDVSKSDESTGVLGKYALYTAFAIPASFVGCAVWQYEHIRSLMMERQARIENPHVGRKEGSFRGHLNAIWNSLPAHQKFGIGIISANVAVFLAWKLGAYRPLLARYFSNSPTKAHSPLSLTLSGFSHTTGFHIFINMYVMWSFMQPLVGLMGREQFLALYLGGATFSGFASCVFKSFKGSLRPSLGASGALFTLVTIACCSYPEARLSIAFVDYLIPHSFSAQNAIVGLVLFDLFGLFFLRNPLLDHAAHLGGVLFGFLYYTYGRKIIWDDFRQSFINRWHKYRSG